MSTLNEKYYTEEELLKYYEKEELYLYKYKTNILIEKYKNAKLIKIKEYIVNDKKEGICIYGYFDEEINYINNIKQGEYKKYYYKLFRNFIPLCEIGNYNNDKKEGAFKIYFIDNKNFGLIFTIGYYNNNLKEGEYIEYDYCYNYMRIKCYYKNDLLHGKYIKYGECGNKYYESNYQNGKKEGEFKFYYQNGDTIPYKITYFTNNIKGD
jgi:hypothetical protein